MQMHNDMPLENLYQYSLHSRSTRKNKQF